MIVRVQGVTSCVVLFQITPRNSNYYYGFYKCKASNIHGTAEHKIQLKEAKPPSKIFQAKLEVITGE